MLAETEFEVAGAKYRAGKLSALDQFHVFRWIGSAFAGREGESFIAALGQLTDENANYVLQKLLSVVQREQPGGGWARVQTTGGALMFEDIDMTVMLSIAVHTLRWNLSGFFSVSPSPSSEQPMNRKTRRAKSSGSHSRKIKTGS